MPPALDPSFAPAGETADDLWLERSLLNGVVLANVAYGILLTITIQCSIGLLNIYRRTGAVAWWICTYVGLMSTMATAAIATQNLFNQWCFIDFRDYPGGPFVFNVSFYATPVNAAGFGLYTIMAWMADGLVLHRFFVIYDRSLAVLVIPALMWLGGVASGILLLISVTHSDDSFYAQRSVNISIAFWSLSLGLNVILTLLISGRLLLARYHLKSTIGPRYGQDYISVVNMLVESASLYSVWALVFLVTYARGSAAQNIFLPALGQIQAIAPLLILTRVISGRAWGTTAGPSYQTGFRSTSIPGGSTIASTAETRIEIPLNRLPDSKTPSDILVQRENQSEMFVK
ncbi:hypothetical protein K435DRAFT_826607 [Dendrothele bispora CBS 962.96]|uniref:Uncharacterized protein n=1 Tax=Dendrothele bispora (strain CBS 962.96) TaxID=1314807 RepID=A0A4S8MR71_DENBC|nr:hypothetical protein K435DRAFT_826607 [Dendrothele bispora CBS 962.96]